MKKKKRIVKSKEQMIAEFAMRKVDDQKKKSLSEIIEYGRKEHADENIRLGHNIATGIDLIQLMLVYEMDDEWLIDFAKRQEEFYKTYQSDDPEDKKYVLDLFQKLEERTRYNALEGVIIDG